MTSLAENPATLPLTNTTVISRPLMSLQQVTTVVKVEAIANALEELTAKIVKKQVKPNGISK